MNSEHQSVDDQSAIRLALLELAGGVLRGELTGGGVEAIAKVDVFSGTTLIDSPAVHESDGTTSFSLALDASYFSDGVTCFVVCLPGVPGILGSYALIGGAQSSDATADYKDEFEILRAEVQALKAAFLEDARKPKLYAAERPLILAELCSEMERSMVKHFQSD